MPRAWPSRPSKQVDSAGVSTRGGGGSRYRTGGSRGIQSNAVTGSGAGLGCRFSKRGSRWSSQPVGAKGTSFAARLIGGAAMVSPCSPHIGANTTAAAGLDTSDMKAATTQKSNRIPNRRARTSAAQRDAAVAGVRVARLVGELIGRRAV